MVDQAHIDALFRDLDGPRPVPSPERNAMFETASRLTNIALQGDPDRRRAIIDRLIDKCAENDVVRITLEGLVKKSEPDLEPDEVHRFADAIMAIDDVWSVSPHLAGLILWYGYRSPELEKRIYDHVVGAVQACEGPCHIRAPYLVRLVAFCRGADVDLCARLLLSDRFRHCPGEIGRTLWALVDRDIAPATLAAAVAFVREHVVEVPVLDKQSVMFITIVASALRRVELPDDLARDLKKCLEIGKRLEREWGARPHARPRDPEES